MSNEKEQAAAIATEQEADLAALQAGAMEQESAAIEAAPAGPDLGAEISGLVLAFVAMAKPILPSLEAIYTPEVTQAAAGAAAKVCEKHGWLPDGIAGQWGEEIAAGIIILPLAVATYRGVKGDLEAANRKAGEGRPEIEAEKRVAEAVPMQWGQMTPQAAPEVAIENH